MGVLRLEAPAEYPISAEEVRTRLRMDDCEGIDGLNRLIAAAARAVENKTQRALVSQKWEFILDSFPGGNSHYPVYCDNIFVKRNSNIISLPLPPLRSIESIKYIDVNGTEQTLPGTEYAVDISSYLGAVYPAYGKAWPATRSQRQAVRIAFTAGYGAAVDVEPDLVLAITLLVGHYDINREAVSDRQMYEIPMGVETILAPYVVPSAP
jgi:uncharacterized phiE125 gp8 family phage protein